mgnify:CR=1 FL=1
MTELKFENMTVAASGDSQNMLGKLLYFSLPSVLVDKDDLRQLCVDMNIPYAGGNRLSVSDAFRSATGDVRDRITARNTANAVFIRSIAGITGVSPTALFPVSW